MNKRKNYIITFKNTNKDKVLYKGLPDFDLIEAIARVLEFMVKERKIKYVVGLELYNEGGFRNYPRGFSLRSTKDAYEGFFFRQDTTLKLRLSLQGYSGPKTYHRELSL